MSDLLLQLDGKTPNLALMRIAGCLRRRGREVVLRHLRNRETVHPDLFEQFDAVYASAIFERTRPLCRRLLEIYPRAIIGGSGWDENAKVTDIGVPEDSPPDYSDYPAFTASLGFTQRGCRLKCSFCKVKDMEGKVTKAATVAEIWRGDPWPRNLLLLDNDFFGEPGWRDEIDAMNSGGFRVSFNQGFNARLIGDEEAAAIASTNYYNSDFDRPALYTAWDNARDEDTLFVNLERLTKYGVDPDEITVYMLIGYDHRTKSARPRLTADDFYRHDRLREFGCRPYPMPYVKVRELTDFQRWVVKRIDCNVSWEDFRRVKCRPELMPTLTIPTPLFDGFTNVGPRKA